ncbi:MAG: hypothetical protein AAF411_08715 [Myxococcota bacterium]
MEGTRPRPRRHASGALGIARTDVDSGTATSPVIGVRVGLDADFHFRRFFFGWTLSAEGLLHVRNAFDNPLRASLRIQSNVQPWVRFGVTFGDSIHARPPPDP